MPRSTRDTPTRRKPEQFRAPGSDSVDFHVNELAADQAGALSPFGTEFDLPLPLEKIVYTHPTPADRPNLADGY